MIIKFTEQVKNNTPEEFEISIKNYFEQILLYRNVKTTKVKGDYGADLIGEYNNEKFVIQVKFYSSPVNLKAVQEVYSSKEYYKADKCIVVTNNTFTESAIKLAHSTNCILIDGSDLNRIYTDKLVSFDKQIEYLKQNKIKSFKITNQELINSYFGLKEQLKRQPTISDIDKLGKYSSSSYRKRWGKWNTFLKYTNEPYLVNNDISKEDLIINFINIKSKIGKIPTTTDMKKLSQYSISKYTREFGTWNKFLETQNIKATKKHLIPKKDFISEFKRVKTFLNKVPTKAEFDNYSTISSNSFKRIWKTWSNFLKEQGIQTRDISNQNLIDEYFKLKKYLDKQILTQSDMNKNGKFSSSTYERRFGSWKKFLNVISEIQ